MILGKARELVVTKLGYSYDTVYTPSLPPEDSAVVSSDGLANLVVWTSFPTDSEFKPPGVFGQAPSSCR